MSCYIDTYNVGLYVFYWGFLMKIKRILLLCLLAAHVVAPVQAMNAPAAAQEGALMGVAKDCGMLLGGIAKGLLATGKYLWSYATPRRLEALAAAGIGYATYNYYYVIKPIETKYSEPFNGQTRISTWYNPINKDKATKWNSHANIRVDSNGFLGLAWGLVSPEKKNQFKNEALALGLTNDAAQKYVEEHVAKHLIEERINHEITELNADLAFLSENFLTYFDVLRYVSKSLYFGIEVDYDAICKKQKNGELDFTINECAEVSQAMEHAIRRKSPLLTCNVNYQNAALLWWKLKKCILRLEIMRMQLTPIKEGKSRFPETIRTDMANSSSQNHRASVVDENS